MKTRCFRFMELGMVVHPAWAGVPSGGHPDKAAPRRQATAKGAASIPWSELGAEAGAQYQGDALAVSAGGAGEWLRCVSQKLESAASREGLWLASSAMPEGTDRIQALTRRVLPRLDPTGPLIQVSVFADDPNSGKLIPEKLRRVPESLLLPSDPAAAYLFQLLPEEPVHLGNEIKADRQRLTVHPLHFSTDQTLKNL